MKVALGIAMAMVVGAVVLLGLAVFSTNYFNRKECDSIENATGHSTRYEPVPVDICYITVDGTTVPIERWRYLEGQ